jgi:acetolactate synthase-1/2/3 large subunit
MNVAEALVKALELNGVKYIFGIPGGAIEDLNNAVYHNEKIQPIVTKNESGAAYMADGFARVSNQLGVCFATTGPGASNLITGLATAYVDGIPIVSLTGQVATSLFGKGAFQESGDEGVNIVSIFRHFTKFSGMVLDEKRSSYMIRKAIRTALASPFGPVHLSLPVDIMKKEVGDPPLPTPSPEPNFFDPEQLNMAASILSRAKKPVILAGWGCCLSRSAKELLALAELLDIPVATSPKGKGIFPESHPLSLGVYGFAGSPVAREYIHGQDIDVLLAVGTSFNEFMSSGWDKNLSPKEHLIHIDIDAEKIGKNFFTSVGIPGAARAVLAQICDTLTHGFRDGTYERPGGDNGRRAAVREMKGKYDALYDRAESTDRGYHPQNLIRDVQRAFPDDTVYFSEIGTMMAWTIRYLIVDRPYTFFVPLGFGGMGYSTAAAVGAKLALVDKPVVAFAGDGGFQMSGFEVATAVNYKIPVIWIVLNNAMHGMIYHGRRMFEKPVPEGIPSRFERVDFAKIAEGLGARGISVDNDGEITRDWVSEMKILESNQPTLIDVRIDEEAIPPIGSRIETVIRHFSS